jgi:GDP-4-dehydro-6-deoxy-D-mannose reductase
MKLLITGFSGFVSRHFLDYLEKNNIRSEIVGVDINIPDYGFDNYKFCRVRFEQIDLLDKGILENLIYTFQPEYILHLASYSSVGFSWKNPSLSFRNNINIFLILMEIVREVIPGCRVLSVGSSEEYGNISEDKLPLHEDLPLSPVSPYAVARVSQENLSKVYSDGYGVDIVMTRSFNHIGPGQKEIFVISSFAKQLVEIQKGLKKEAKLITGDISVVRDFLDVRDVVDAYYKLMKTGKKGEVYNICSGNGVTLKKVIELMCEILGIEVDIRTDPALIRPNDNKMIVGSNEKIKSNSGWKQNTSLNDSLKDILSYWSERLNQ